MYYARLLPPLQDLLAEGVDLLVATPGRLAEHLEAGNLSLAACRVLVMDEVDVLLGEQGGEGRWQWVQSGSSTMGGVLEGDKANIRPHHAMQLEKFCLPHGRPTVSRRN